MTLRAARKARIAAIRTLASWCMNLNLHATLMGNASSTTRRIKHIGYTVLAYEFGHLHDDGSYHH